MFFGVLQNVAAEYIMHSGVRYEVKVHVVSYGKASTSTERTIIPREFFTYELIKGYNILVYVLVYLTHNSEFYSHKYTCLAKERSNKTALYGLNSTNLHHNSSLYKGRE